MLVDRRRRRGWRVDSALLGLLRTPTVKSVSPPALAHPPRIGARGCIVSALTAPLPLHPIVTSAEVSAVGCCEVCAHSMADHDPIAGRYCSATLANALTRGCICPTRTP